MPVHRYQSIEVTPDPPRRRPGDPGLYRAMAAVWKTSRRLAPRQFPPGVYRFHTLGEMARQRDQWDAAFVAKLAQHRSRSVPEPGRAHIDENQR